MRTLFNADDISAENVNDILKDNGIDNPTEIQIEEVRADLAEDNYSVVIDELMNDTFYEYSKSGDAYVVMQGDSHLWNGRHACGTIDTFKNMYDKITRMADNIELYDDDGTLQIDAYHHDGHNVYRVRKLTDLGVEIYENRYYTDEYEEFADMDDQDFHALFFNDDKYSKSCF